MTEPRWLPTEPEIRAAIDRQRAERERMALRVDDGPQTILVPRGRAMTQRGKFVDSFPFEDIDQREGYDWAGMRWPIVIIAAFYGLLWLALSWVLGE